LFPVKNENQEILFVVNTYVDITDLKRAEKEARKHQDALARVDRAASMGQLTGSIAHELNQPLTGVLSNAQAAELLLKSGQWEPAELEEIMAAIVADTKRGGEVIQNLRELFREQEVEFLPVDINAIVHETTLLLHSEFVLQNVTLTTDSDSTIPTAYGNRIQLQQVLVNLIMNGIEAMVDMEREARRLHIATAYEADIIKVWVEDCGPGIGSDKIDHIFEPLATWKTGGTGMGLAISNSIIKAHGGTMWAENKPDGGARVGYALLLAKEG
jgi:C4-dicarboxylate-specific signal transduction histidine kinase